MRRLLACTAALAALGGSGRPLVAQSRPLKTKHVVVIVTDGLRWQEVVSGAERALISEQPGGVDDTAAVRRTYWRDSLEARRAALLPFVWGTIARDGQIYGNPSQGSIAHTTNPLKFSYPGYNEILTGAYDPAITSNDAPPNANVTVFEWLSHRPSVRGKVAAIGTWTAFRRIFNRDRAGFPVYDGWDPPFANEKRRTPRQDAIDEMYASGIRYWPDNNFDAPMHLAAKEILKRDKPSLLFVGYGETDEWAHSGRYDLLLESAHRVDGYIADLWRTVQADPAMRGTTTFIITTDHGRGDGATGWKSHGRDVNGADRIWMAVLGPDTPSRGDHVQTADVTQAQIAATVASFFGEDWRSARPDAGAPIDEMLGRAPRTAAKASAVAPRRVVLLSLDGFRADYINRPGAVNLRRLAARGTRAERMIPAFPSKTFPNHYSIVTGLTPEHHGIVANTIRDSVLGTFRLSDTAAVRNAKWWGGEPIWVTAEKQGQRAASYFWPGSETTIGGVRPTWSMRYNGATPNGERVNQVLRWLAMPRDSAPSLITLYFSTTDDAGHAYGPFAAETDSAIARADSAVGAVMDGIDRLGMADQVDLVVVADHGMTDISKDRAILLDDYLDLSTVDVVDLSPVSAIQPHAGESDRVYAALAQKHPHMQVFRKGEVPERWHFNANSRITSIVLVADEGWTITTRANLAKVKGATHGYDPELPSMGALFVAAGPDIAVGKVVPPFRNVHVYSLLTHFLGLRPAPNDGSLDSVRAVLKSH